jgi:hypothetical protein
MVKKREQRMLSLPFNVAVGVVLAVLLAAVIWTIHEHRLAIDEKYEERHYDRKADRLIAEVRKELAAKKQDMQ